MESPFAERLLSWYRQAARPLPWRETTDPYAIWVSEAMLQQTRVETVIGYYHRFLARFSTVADLAAAPIDDVLKLWEGLGYYSRARNLHRAAARIVSDHGGLLPQRPEVLKTLPGIGPYMAHAVASIAFSRPVAVLDGNVERVLARVDAVDTPVKENATRKRLQARAQALLERNHPGDFNQAMMELGATVCTPKNPDCAACPVAAFCTAHAMGTPANYPVAAPKRATPHHHIAVAVVEKSGRYLAVRRPDTGLLGGLWEFPGGRLADGETPSAGVARKMLDRFGLEVAVEDPLTPVKHAFTHFKVTLHPHLCTAGDAQVRPAYHTAHRWLLADELTALALPVAHRKISGQLGRQLAVTAKKCPPSA